MKIAFILLLIHYIGDFLLQDEKTARNKSTDHVVLLKHSINYTLVYFLFFGLWCAYQNHFGSTTVLDMGWELKTWLFFPIIFLTHFMTDLISSRIVKKKFDNLEFYSPIPNLGAFSIIGLDQLIHFGTLFLTYYALTN